MDVIEKARDLYSKMAKKAKTEEMRASLFQRAR